MQFSFDINLNKIAEKVEANERLTSDEGVVIYKIDNVYALGKLVDFLMK